VNGTAGLMVGDAFSGVPSLVSTAPTAAATVQGGQTNIFLLGVDGTPATSGTNGVDCNRKIIQRHESRLLQASQRTPRSCSPRRRRASPAAVKAERAVALSPASSPSTLNDYDDEEVAARETSVPG